MKKCLTILLILFKFYALSAFEPALIGSAQLEPDQVKWKNFYLLTPDTEYNLGALWYPTPLPNFHSNFMIDLIANFGFDEETAYGQGPGADGIAFVLHRDPRDTSAIGGPGVAIGYGHFPLFPDSIRKSFVKYKLLFLSIARLYIFLLKSFSS